jgi:hypothetical protein
LAQGLKIELDIPSKTVDEYEIRCDQRIVLVHLTDQLSSSCLDLHSADDACNRPSLHQIQSSHYSSMLTHISETTGTYETSM